MSDAAARLTAVQNGIANATRLSRREQADVTLVAVSKTRSGEEIEPLIASGQRDFGESRAQEAQAKWTPLRARHADLRLHLVGRLQSNKAEDAVATFNVIHSLDRPSLLDALAAAADRLDRRPSVYVQVNIGEEEQKGGVSLNDLPDLLARVRSSPLPLAGLMCIPPLGPEPAPFFALLARLARRHGVAGLSMGMSGDYPTAVMLGATAVRVGAALFED